MGKRMPNPNAQSLVFSVSFPSPMLNENFHIMALPDSNGEYINVWWGGEGGGAS